MYVFISHENACLLKNYQHQFQAFAVNVCASYEYLGNVTFHCITLFNSPRKVYVKTQLLIISKNVGEKTNIYVYITFVHLDEK